MTRARDADLVWTVTDGDGPGGGEAMWASRKLNVRSPWHPSAHSNFFRSFFSGDFGMRRSARAAQPSVVIGRDELQVHSNPSSRTMLSRDESERSKMEKTSSIVSPGTTGALVLSHRVPP